MRSSIDLSGADHPVKAVTIFSQGKSGYVTAAKADIVRAFSVDLKEGENIVHIHGLSSNIDRDSVRVSELSDDLRFVDAHYYPVEGDVQEAIRRLRKKEMLDKLKYVRTQEASILVQYGMSLKGTDVEPEKATAFLATFVQNSQGNISAIEKIDEELFEIGRAAKQLQYQAAERKGGTDGHVVIVLHSKLAMTADICLSYLAERASWNAAYDLHAMTEGGQPSTSVKVHFRARVSQSIGEDWRDTSLMLSTATFDSLVQDLPKFRLLRIAPLAPPSASIWFGTNSDNISQSGRYNAFAPAPPRSNNTTQSSSTVRQSVQLVGGVIPYSVAAVSGPYGIAPAAQVDLPGILDAVKAGIPQYEPFSAQKLGDTHRETETDALSMSEFTNEGLGSEARTIVNESPFSRTYRVDGKSSVPATGGTTKSSSPSCHSRPS